MALKLWVGLLLGYCHLRKKFFPANPFIDPNIPFWTFKMPNFGHLNSYQSATASNGRKIKKKFCNVVKVCLFSENHFVFVKNVFSAPIVHLCKILAFFSPFFHIKKSYQSATAGNGRKIFFSKKIFSLYVFVFKKPFFVSIIFFFAPTHDFCPNFTLHFMCFFTLFSSKFEENIFNARLRPGKQTKLPKCEKNEKFGKSRCHLIPQVTFYPT